MSERLRRSLHQRLLRVLRLILRRAIAELATSAKRMLLSGSALWDMLLSKHCFVTILNRGHYLKVEILDSMNLGVSFIFLFGLDGSRNIRLKP